MEENSKGKYNEAVEGVELKDIKIDLSNELNISNLEANFDIWFDNIFTDFSVLSKIQDADKSLKALKSKVCDLVNNINSKKANNVTKLNEIEKEIDDKLKDITNA